MGDSLKWVKRKNGEKKERERLNNGDNNGQATHGDAWRTQAAWANKHKTTEVTNPDQQN